jgi:spore maturation protein CgeB
MQHSKKNAASVLFIGHYSEGSTSKMRGEYIRELLTATRFDVINIDVPNLATWRPFRSIGWRFKKGPLITNISNYVNQQVDKEYSYDLVWVEKGVFIDPKIISRLRKSAKLLVHFTPDPAFTYHKSELFYRAIPNYDYCVTTKSFEIESYKAAGAKETLFCTQGYDPKLHKPYHSFENKKGVVFIGHKEGDREEILAKLLESKIHVTLAGINWGSFAFKNKRSEFLNYRGNGIFGNEYARTISGGLISPGFLSKIIPEMHTTRTFEIPACGTGLITEKNLEIESFFSDEEVIFFSNPKEFIEKTERILKDKEALKVLIEKGRSKVSSMGLDYQSIIEKILRRIGLL